MDLCTNRLPLMLAFAFASAHDYATLLQVGTMSRPQESFCECDNAEKYMKRFSDNLEVMGRSLYEVDTDGDKRTEKITAMLGQHKLKPESEEAKTAKCLGTSTSFHKWLDNKFENVLAAEHVSDTGIHSLREALLVLNHNDPIVDLARYRRFNYNRALCTNDEEFNNTTERHRKRLGEFKKKSNLEIFKAMSTVPTNFSQFAFDARRELFTAVNGNLAVQLDWITGWLDGNPTSSAISNNAFYSPSDLLTNLKKCITWMERAKGHLEQINAFVDKTDWYNTGHGTLKKQVEDLMPLNKALFFPWKNTSSASTLLENKEKQEEQEKNERTAMVEVRKALLSNFDDVDISVLEIPYPITVDAQGQQVAEECENKSHLRKCISFWLDFQQFNWSSPESAERRLRDKWGIAQCNDKCGPTHWFAHAFHDVIPQLTEDEWFDRFDMQD